MAHMWFMHDAHLGRAFLFLGSLAEYTLLLMTTIGTLPSWRMPEIEGYVHLTKSQNLRRRGVPTGEPQDTPPSCPFVIALQ